MGFSGARAGEVRPRRAPRMRRAQPRFRAHHFQPHHPHQPLHVLLLTVRPVRPRPIDRHGLLRRRTTRCSGERTTRTNSNSNCWSGLTPGRHNLRMESRGDRQQLRAHLTRSGNSLRLLASRCVASPVRLARRGFPIDGVRAADALAECAVSGGPRSLRDLPYAGGRSARRRRAAPVRRAGISRVPALRVPGRRLRSLPLPRLWFRPAGPVLV